MPPTARWGAGGGASWRRWSSCLDTDRSERASWLRRRGSRGLAPGGAVSRAPARLLVLALLALACAPEKRAPPPRAQPRPLEPLERVLAGAGEEDPIQRVVPFTPLGPPLPEGATVVVLAGEAATVGGAPVDVARLEGPVLLRPTPDTFLVQAAGLLAALADAKREVWLEHPDAPIAFELTLRDEAGFQAWLDDPTPGKLRIIHRADGFEMQTNLGKLPGVDRNGPTVPVRGGQMDLTTLARGFEQLRGRFLAAPDVCFVPSFGMELQQVARAMSPNFTSATKAWFPETCLVYPRPKR